MKLIKPNDKWVRISIEVEADTAETISEIFARYSGTGVVLEEHAPSDGLALVTVSAYLVNDSALLSTQNKIEHVVNSLRLIQPLEELSYKGIAEQNWMEAWKERFTPLNVGRKFLVQPAWLENPDTRRHVIRIDPGMAFGTGVHPTTQLALELMEKNIQPGWKILDLGAGSGILSFAAEKLGADAVLGIEIDADAIDNALHNAEINNSSVDLMHGSIDDAKEKRPATGFDMVIANIIATKLLVLIADGLCQLVSDKGQLLLSGILVEQMHEIESSLGEMGYEVKESKQKEDWLTLIAQKRT